MKKYKCFLAAMDEMIPWSQIISQLIQHPVFMSYFKGYILKYNLPPIGHEMLAQLIEAHVKCFVLIKLLLNDDVVYAHERCPSWLNHFTKADQLPQNHSQYYCLQADDTITFLVQEILQTHMQMFQKHHVLGYIWQLILFVFYHNTQNAAH